MGAMETPAQPKAAAPNVQQVRSVEDLDRIVFTDGVAAVEAPAELLRSIRFKNAKRIDGPRLDAVIRSIRARGYSPVDPIIARIGQKGKWVVVDGGHRLTALRRIGRSLWSRLFGRTLGNVYFLLFETDRSWTKAARPAAAGDAGPAVDKDPDAGR